MPTCLADSLTVAKKIKHSWYLRYLAESGAKTATPLVPSLALMIICDTMPVVPERKMSCVAKNLSSVFPIRYNTNHAVQI